MGELSELKNISKVTENLLNRVGIRTIDEFRRKDVKETFVLIREMDCGACLSLLYGLYGAMTDTRWCDLDNQTKTELKRFFQSLK